MSRVVPKREVVKRDRGCRWGGMLRLFEVGAEFGG